MSKSVVSNIPEMSVVLVTPDNYETIRKTMQHLRAQTVADRLEIVIAAPSATEFNGDEADEKAFARCLVIEVGKINSTAKARAVCIRQSSAPIVVFGEDHCYPDQHWAQALIEAHRQPWAAVGPALCNANPDSLISWADTFINNSRWVEPAQAGVADDLPGRNSSYKRDLLLKYESRLEDMLETEYILHQDLKNRGHQLYVEPAAKTYHFNFTRLSSLVREQFFVGQILGSARAQNWPVLRRVVYIGGGLLIPLVRLRRILPEVRRIARQQKQHRLLPRVLPALMIGLIAAATGEVTGYLFGVGRSSQRLAAIEFHRHGR